MIGGGMIRANRTRYREGLSETAKARPAALERVVVCTIPGGPGWPGGIVRWKSPGARSVEGVE